MATDFELQPSNSYKLIGEYLLIKIFYCIKHLRHIAK
jgi:hypothetical protein